MTDFKTIGEVAAAAPCPILGLQLLIGLKNPEGDTCPVCGEVHQPPKET